MLSATTTRWISAFAIVLILLPVPAMLLLGMPQWFGYLAFWSCLLFLSLCSNLPLEVRGLLLITVSVLCSAITPLYASTLAKEYGVLSVLIARAGDMFYLIGGGVGGNFIAHGIIERKSNSRGAE